jgi:hypothetical protein
MMLEGRIINKEVILLIAGQNLESDQPQEVEITNKWN